MRIYIAHSRDFDYEQLLYAPIRSQAKLPQDDIILPHEPGCNNHHTREFYAQLNLVIAEVSYSATGLGIELGWAFDSHVQITCLYRQGTKPSSSLWVVTNQFYEYATPAQMIDLITKVIQEHTSDTKSS